MKQPRASFATVSCRGKIGARQWRVSAAALKAYVEGTGENPAAAKGE